MRETCDFDSESMPRVLTSVEPGSRSSRSTRTGSHPAGRDSGEVAVRHDRDQRGFGTFAPFEQPLGRIRA